jgi:hypothetical protein
MTGYPSALTSSFSNELTPAQLRERIEEAYRASGNRLGYRFLYSPASVLDGAEVALIGLNPGGTYAPPEHAEFCMEEGKSAYRDEAWEGYRRRDTDARAS